MSSLDVPPPRAQQERTREVRRRILDAAVTVLVEKGYAQATTLSIQERAGVSRGRLLHHFPSRDTLLLAAAHHLATDRLAESEANIVWPVDPAARIDAAIDQIATTYGQSFFWAATELWVASRAHDDLRAQLFPAEQGLGAMIRTSTDGFFGPALTAHHLYPQVRDMIHTSLRGIALTTAFDPRPGTMALHADKLKVLARQILLPATPTHSDPSSDRLSPQRLITQRK